MKSQCLGQYEYDLSNWFCNSERADYSTYIRKCLKNGISVFRNYVLMFSIVTDTKAFSKLAERPIHTVVYNLLQNFQNDTK
jgi:hypothetical protein